MSAAAAVLHPVTPAGLDATPGPLLLTVDQVAGLVGLSRRTVWALVSTGDLPSPVKIGRATRWKRADVEDWVAGLE